jgi:HAD superfamily hydrolase (TIGR01549 family)
MTVAPTRAFIWDFDGTIVDSFSKNLSITRAIIAKVAGRPASDFEPLATLPCYEAAQRTHSNWRSFYIDGLGLTEEQTDSAGALWSEYQQRDQTPTPVFDGLAATFSSLRAYPHGIVSQNARASIERCLGENDLARFFACIIGYQEVPLRSQKPAPDGLLLCIQRLQARTPGRVFYLGDHETDILTGRNANRVLEAAGTGIEIVTIAVTFSTKHAGASWTCAPDHIARRPQDILRIVATSERS